MTRGIVLFLATAAATGRAAVAGEAADFGEDFLTPEEGKKRELERKRGAQPVLVCAPGALHAAVREGESVDVGFTVRNAGGRILRWAVTTAPEWARFDSRSGELGFGEARKLFVTFSAAGLGEGLVSEKIVVEAEGASGSPLTLAVELEVERALETPSPEDRRPARTVEPAGPWTVRISRAVVDADVMLRGMYQSPVEPDTLVVQQGEGFAVNASYGTRVRSTTLELEVGLSRSEANYFDGMSDYSHTLVGARWAFKTGEQMRTNISAGYSRFEFEGTATMPNILADGRGLYLGLGASYMPGRRGSLHVELRWSRSDGDWKDLFMGTEGAMEEKSLHLDLGMAVHF